MTMELFLTIGVNGVLSDHHVSKHQATEISEINQFLPCDFIEYLLYILNEK
jgi:hypothetical protein